MDDLRDIKQALDERDILKGHCETLITLYREFEKVADGLKKENEKLKKTQDPNRQKVLIDLLAQAKRGNGIKAINATMAKIKNK